MPRIQTEYLAGLSAVGRKGVASPADKFLVSLAKFKPQNYGMRGLIVDRRTTVSFCRTRINDKGETLGVAIDYPRGTDRSSYFQSYECMGASLICSRLIKECFGKVAQITRMIGVSRIYDHHDNAYKDSGFTHYTVDVTGLLAEQPALKDCLEQLGVIHSYEGRAYLDPIPHNIKKYTSAQPYEMRGGADLLELYTIGLNEALGLTWPGHGNGIRWSTKITLPELRPELQENPLIVISIHGSEIENDDYTGENFSFRMPIYADQWDIFVRCAGGAMMDRQALEPEIGRHCQISPKMSISVVKPLILDEGINLIIEVVGLLDRAMRSQPASSILALAQSVVRVGRNDPCPCGSGRKFKKCCDKQS